MSAPLVARSGIGGLPAQAEQARDAALAMLRELDPAAATWVEQIHTARSAKPSIVVVGETKRGKSSLVNALLATPNLSPVDAAVASVAYLLFEHAESWHAQACYPGQPGVPVELSRLVRWISAGHELPEGQLPPRYLRVAGPCPLLERVSLVDTPGVGGFDSMHGELAKEAAASATAVLFVVDASAPFTAGEVGFLRRVAAQVETIEFVLSKTDVYHGWRQVLEADRQLLAEHVPRLAGASFHPVSARMFEMADKARTEQAAALLRTKSGIAQVQVALQEAVVGRTAMLGEANTLRALSGALGEQQSNLRAGLRALSAGAVEANALRERRDQLTLQRRSSTRGWQLSLRREIQRTRLECGHEVSRQMRDVQAWFRQQIEAADADRLEALPHEVDSALQVVSARVSAMLGQRLDELTVAALSQLFTVEELRAIRSRFDRAGHPPVVIRAPDKKPPAGEDKLLVFLGVSGGVGAGKLAAAPLAGLALNPLVLPATVVIGLGAGWWMARTRKHAANRQHCKQWLTEAIADARSTMDRLVTEQIIDAEQQLSLALGDALTRRIEAIDAELKDVGRAIKLDDRERAEKLAVVSKRLAEVTEVLERIEGFLGKVRALCEAGGPPSG